MTPISISRRRAFAVAGVFLLAFLALYVYRTASIPADSPIARMYRTEADLAMLGNALDHYRSEYGRYPQPGAEGLAAATEFLSETGNYLPGGPPSDGWGRPYVYATAQDSARVYSLGADGINGREGIPGSPDDIGADGASRSYRTHYRALQREFMQAVGSGK